MQVVMKISNMVAFGITNPLWLIASLLSVELYPTAVRNLANSLFSMVGRVGAIIAPQILFLVSFYN